MQYPIEWIRTLVQNQLAGNCAQIQLAANDFDNWIELLDEGQILEQGRNTNFLLHPAHYWTHVAGKQFVNFVGKVESFESDFAIFCQQANLDEVPRVNANVVELDARSSIGGTGYRYADRMNAASVQKINSLFADDFDIFGYVRIGAG